MTNHMMIFQSGERVRVAGTYEVVGITHRASTKHHNPRERSVLYFYQDELFPCHDGREVCWHRLSADAERGSANVRH